MLNRCQLYSIRLASLLLLFLLPFHLKVQQRFQFRLQLDIIFWPWRIFSPFGHKLHEISLRAFKGKATIERLLDLDDLILILNCTWRAFSRICKRIEADAHSAASMGYLAELVLGLDVICLWRRMQA